MEWIAIAVFVVAYALIASDRINKTLVALVGAAIVVVLGVVESSDVFYSHETGIDWDVIFLLLGDSGAGVLALSFVFLACLFHCPELFVPDRLQSVGDQPVVVIDPHIADGGLLGLVLCPFDNLTTQPIGLRQALLELLLDV